MEIYFFIGVVLINIALAAAYISQRSLLLYIPKDIEGNSHFVVYEKIKSGYVMKLYSKEPKKLLFKHEVAIEKFK